MRPGVARRGGAVLVGAVSLAAPGFALADAAAPAICVADAGGWRLDREALAARTLAALKLDLTSLSPAGVDQVRREGVAGGFYAEVLRAILSDGPKTGDKPPRPYGGVNAASHAHVRGYFTDHPPSANGVPFPNGVSWSSIYLTDPAAPIACDPAQVADQTPGPATSRPAPPTDFAAAVGHLRVRGGPDGLLDDRGSGAFRGDAPATFAVLRDGSARTTTYKVVGALGVALASVDPDTRKGYGLIAYAALNYADTQAFAGAARPAASNAYDIGMIGSHFFGNAPGPEQRDTGGVWVSVRPDYLWDANDHSRLFTGNLLITPRFGVQVTPTARWELNSYHAFAGFSVEPALALKVNGGVYAHGGSSAAAARQPMVARGGGQFGVNIVSDDKALPLTLNISYVYLVNLEAGKDIGYFNTGLTFSLDDHKYTGITLNYNNGNLESTGKRQEQATVGLSFKY